MKTPPARSDEARSIGLRTSRRSAVPPFIVMDVMEAAAAREALGHNVIHMEVGPAGHARTARGARCRQAGARPRDARVHGGPGAARAARPHRRPLPPALRHRGRARAGGGDDGVVGRLRAGVSGPVRCRRQGGPAVARLSLLPAYPDRARARIRFCSPPMPPRAGCRPRARSTTPRRGKAWRASSSPAPPTRRAPCWRAAGWPRSSRPAGVTTSGWSPTRSTTASPMGCRRRRRWRTARTRSWSTASPSISP